MSVFELIDFEFYHIYYRGKLEEDDWLPGARFAAVYIHSKTDYIFEKNGYPASDSSLGRRLKLCLCALAEEKVKYTAVGGKTSESVGNYSVSYAEVTSADEEKAYMKILEMYIPDVIKTVKWI